MMIKRRTLTLVTLGALVLVVSLSLVLQDTTTVTAREMLHPCPDAGENHTQEEHDNTCGTHTPTAEPTDPPANFKVHSIGANSVSLQWGRLRSYHGIISAHISVYQQPEGSELGEYKYIGRYSADKSGGSLRVSNLKSDTWYQFFLLYNTRRRLGMGGMLLVRTQTDPTQPTRTPTPTPTPTPTDAPVNFRVTGVSHNGISLQWGPPPRNRGITWAEVIRYDHDGSKFRFPAAHHYSVGISFLGESSLHMSLKSDTLYRFTLRYLDSDGDSVMSWSVTARTLADATQPTPTPTPTLADATQPTPTPTPTLTDATQPTPTPTPTLTDAPVNFRVTGVSHNSISLQWGAAPPNRGIISGELVEYEHNGSEYRSIGRFIVGIPDTGKVGRNDARDLKSDTLYRFTLRYLDSDGDSVMSWSVTARTLADATQPTPTPTPTPVASLLTAPALTAKAGEYAVELSWESVPGAVRYELMVWWHPLPAWQSIGGVTGTSYMHSELTAGREYYYTIRAVNAADEKSDWQLDYASATVSAPTATQPTPTPTPTPVASLLTVPALTAKAGEYAVELSWESVPGAVRYELMVWWHPLPAWQSIGGVTGTSYMHSELTAGREYYYTIRAVNAADEKSDWQLDYASATALAPTVQ